MRKTFAAGAAKSGTGCPTRVNASTGVHSSSRRSATIQAARRFDDKPSIILIRASSIIVTTLNPAIGHSPHFEDRPHEDRRSPARPRSRSSPPGIPSSRTVSTHIRRLASRLSPIIVCAAPASPSPPAEPPIKPVVYPIRQTPHHQIEIQIV